MTASRVRYGRQRRLAEIGEAGQARLEAAVVCLAAQGFAREIERSYLDRAGPRTGEDGLAIEVDPAILGLRHEAAREVGEGALRALAAIRKVVLEEKA